MFVSGCSCVRVYVYVYMWVVGWVGVCIYTFFVFVCLFCFFCFVLCEFSHGFQLAQFNRDLIVLGGTQANGDKADGAKALTPDVLWYNVDSDTWTVVEPAMPAPREGVVKGYGMRAGIVIFVVGGSDKDQVYSNTTNAYALRC